MHHNCLFETLQQQFTYAIQDTPRLVISLDVCFCHPCNPSKKTFPLRRLSVMLRQASFMRSEHQTCSEHFASLGEGVEVSSLLTAVEEGAEASFH